MKKFITIILFFSASFNLHAMKRQSSDFYNREIFISEPSLEFKKNYQQSTILDLINEALKTLKTEYPCYSVSSMRQGAKTRETLMHPQAQPTDHLIIFTLTKHSSKIISNFEIILDIKKNSLDPWDGQKKVDDLVIL